MGDRYGNVNIDGLQRIKDLKVVDLKRELEQRGLNKYGNKKELVQRLAIFEEGRQRSLSAKAKQETPNQWIEEDSNLDNEFIRDYFRSQKARFQELNQHRSRLGEGGASESPASKPLIGNVDKPAVLPAKGPTTSTPNFPATVPSLDDEPKKAKGVKITIRKNATQTETSINAKIVPPRITKSADVVEPEVEVPSPPHHRPRRQRPVYIDPPSPLVDNDSLDEVLPKTIHKLVSDSPPLCQKVASLKIKLPEPVPKKPVYDGKALESGVESADVSTLSKIKEAVPACMSPQNAEVSSSVGESSPKSLRDSPISRSNLAGPSKEWDNKTPPLLDKKLVKDRGRSLKTKDEAFEPSAKSAIKPTRRFLSKHSGRNQKSLPNIADPDLNEEILKRGFEEPVPKPLIEGVYIPQQSSTPLGSSKPLIKSKSKKTDSSSQKPLRKSSRVIPARPTTESGPNSQSPAQPADDKKSDSFEILKQQIALPLHVENFPTEKSEVSSTSELMESSLMPMVRLERLGPNLTELCRETPILDSHMIVEGHIDKDIIADSGNEPPHISRNDPKPKIEERPESLPIKDEITSPNRKERKNSYLIENLLEKPEVSECNLIVKHPKEEVLPSVEENKALPEKNEESDCEKKADPQSKSPSKVCNLPPIGPAPQSFDILNEAAMVANIEEKKCERNKTDHLKSKIKDSAEEKESENSMKVLKDPLDEKMMDIPKSKTSLDLENVYKNKCQLDDDLLEQSFSDNFHIRKEDSLKNTSKSLAAAENLLKSVKNNETSGIFEPKRSGNLEKNVHVSLKDDIPKVPGHKHCSQDESVTAVENLLISAENNSKSSSSLEFSQRTEIDNDEHASKYNLKADSVESSDHMLSSQENYVLIKDESSTAVENLLKCTKINEESGTVLEHLPKSSDPNEGTHMNLKDSLSKSFDQAQSSKKDGQQTEGNDESVTAVEHLLSSTKSMDEASTSIELSQMPEIESLQPEKNVQDQIHLGDGSSQCSGDTKDESSKAVENLLKSHATDQVVETLPSQGKILESESLKSLPQVSKIDAKSSNVIETAPLEIETMEDRSSRTLSVNLQPVDHSKDQNLNISTPEVVSVDESAKAVSDLLFVENLLTNSVVAETRLDETLGNECAISVEQSTKAETPSMAIPCHVLPLEPPLPVSSISCLELDVTPQKDILHEVQTSDQMKGQTPEGSSISTSIPSVSEPHYDAAATSLPRIISKQSPKASESQVSEKSSVNIVEKSIDILQNDPSEVVVSETSEELHIEKITNLCSQVSGEKSDVNIIPPVTVGKSSNSSMLIDQTNKRDQSHMSTELDLIPLPESKPTSLPSQSKEDHSEKVYLSQSQEAPGKTECIRSILKDIEVRPTHSVESTDFLDKSVSSQKKQQSLDESSYCHRSSSSKDCQVKLTELPSNEPVSVEIASLKEESIIEETDPVQSSGRHCAIGKPTSLSSEGSAISKTIQKAEESILVSYDDSDDSDGMNFEACDTMQKSKKLPSSIPKNEQKNESTTICTTSEKASHSSTVSVSMLDSLVEPEASQDLSFSERDRSPTMGRRRKIKEDEEATNGGAKDLTPSHTMMTRRRSRSRSIEPEALAPRKTSRHSKSSKKEAGPVVQEKEEPDSEKLDIILELNESMETFNDESEPEVAKEVKKSEKKSDHKRSKSPRHKEKSKSSESRRKSRRKSRSRSREPTEHRRKHKRSRSPEKEKSGSDSKSDKKRPRSLTPEELSRETGKSESPEKRGSQIQEKKLAAVKSPVKKQRSVERSLSPESAHMSPVKPSKKFDGHTTNGTEDAVLKKAVSPSKNDEVQNQSPKKGESEDATTANAEVKQSPFKSARTVSLSRSKTSDAPSVNKKRKWGSTQQKQSISISSDSLKSLIPDVKPLSSGDVHLDVFSDEDKEDKPPTPGVEEPKPSPVEKKERHSKESRDSRPTKQTIRRERIVYNSPPPKSRDRRRSEEEAPRSVKVKPTTVVGQTAVPAARHSISPVLLIQNLVRPFTMKQLKDLLQRTGKLVENGFWIDNIKSKCIAMYENEDQSIETRIALHGVKWPSVNPKNLHVDFSSESELKKRLAESPHLNPILANETRFAKRKVDGPIREWDLAKMGERSPGERERERENKRREREEERQRNRERQRELSTEPEHSTKSASKPKSLDDIFKKTKAQPAIYWLPLTPQQISEKEAQRRKRMAESAKLLAEMNAQQERQREEREKERIKRREKEKERRKRSRSRSRRRSRTPKRSPKRARRSSSHESRSSPRRSRSRTRSRS